MKYDTFLLDADDTLFDFSACAKNALRAALQEWGIADKEAYHARYLAVNDRLWQQIERREITHDQLVVRRFEIFLSEIGRKDVPAGAFNDSYVRLLGEQTAAFDGAEAFLAELCSLGRVYIVTNGTASVQRERFASFGMERFVRGVFISEEIGHYKPSPGYYRYCAEHIPDYRRENTLLIGDGLTSDIAMATAAGVDCVWFNRLRRAFVGERRPTYETETYAQILRIARGGTEN